MNIASSSYLNLSTTGTLSIVSLATNILVTPTAFVSTYNILLPEYTTQISCIITMANTSSVPGGAVVNVKDYLGNLLYTFPYWDTQVTTPVTLSQVPNSIQVVSGSTYYNVTLANTNVTSILPYTQVLSRGQNNGVNLIAKGYLATSQNVFNITLEDYNPFFINFLHGNDLYVVSQPGCSIELNVNEQASLGKVVTFKNVTESTIYVTGNYIDDIFVGVSVPIYAGGQLSLAYCWLVGGIYQWVVIGENIEILNTQIEYTIPVNSNSITSPIVLPEQAITANILNFIDEDVNDPCLPFETYSYLIPTPLTSSVYPGYTVYYVNVDLVNPSTVITITTLGGVAGSVDLTSNGITYLIVVFSNGNIAITEYGNTLVSNWESSLSSWSNIYIPGASSVGVYVMDAFPFVVSLTNGNGAQITLTQSYSNWLKTVFIPNYFTTFNYGNPSPATVPTSEILNDVTSWVTNGSYTSIVNDYAVGNLILGNYYISNFRRYRPFRTVLTTDPGYNATLNAYTIQSTDIGQTIYVEVASTQLAIIVFPDPTTLILPTASMSNYIQATNTNIYFAAQPTINTQIILINRGVSRAFYSRSSTATISTDSSAWFYADQNTTNSVSSSTVSMQATSFGSITNLGSISGFTPSSIARPSLTALAPLTQLTDRYVALPAFFTATDPVAVITLSPTPSGYPLVLCNDSCALFYLLSSPIIQSILGTSSTSSLSIDTVFDPTSGYLYCPTSRSNSGYFAANTSSSNYYYLGTGGSTPTVSNIYLGSIIGITAYYQNTNTQAKVIGVNASNSFQILDPTNNAIISNSEAGFVGLCTTGALSSTNVGAGPLFYYYYISNLNVIGSAQYFTTLNNTTYTYVAALVQDTYAVVYGCNPISVGPYSLNWLLFPIVAGVIATTFTFYNGPTQTSPFTAVNTSSFYLSDGSCGNFATVAEGGTNRICYTYYDGGSFTNAVSAVNYTALGTFYNSQTGLWYVINSSAGGGFYIQNVNGWYAAETPLIYQAFSSVDSTFTPKVIYDRSGNSVGLIFKQVSSTSQLVVSLINLAVSSFIAGTFATFSDGNFFYYIDGSGIGHALNTTTFAAYTLPFSAFGTWSMSSAGDIYTNNGQFIPAGVVPQTSINYFVEIDYVGYSNPELSYMKVYEEI